MGDSLVRSGDDPACLRPLALPANPTASRFARAYGAVSRAAGARAFSSAPTLLRISLGSGRKSWGRPVDCPSLKTVRTRTRHKADSDVHPAANSGGISVCCARSAQSNPPDCFVCITVRVWPSFFIRVRQFRFVDGTGLPRLRTVAEARAAGADVAAIGALRASLLCDIHLSHLWLGCPWPDVFFGRSRAAARPGRKMVGRRSACRPASCLPRGSIASTPVVASWGAGRRRHWRLVQLASQKLVD